MFFKLFSIHTSTDVYNIWIPLFPLTNFSNIFINKIFEWFPENINAYVNINWITMILKTKKDIYVCIIYLYRHFFAWNIFTSIYLYTKRQCAYDWGKTFNTRNVKIDCGLCEIILRLYKASISRVFFFLPGI